MQNVLFYIQFELAHSRCLKAIFWSPVTPDMFMQKLLLAAALAVAARAGDFVHARSDGTPPTAFDGQYMTNPVPAAGNQAVEWWWFQVLGEADPTTGIVPSFAAIFYLGVSQAR